MELVVGALVGHYVVLPEQGLLAGKVSTLVSRPGTADLKSGALATQMATYLCRKGLNTADVYSLRVETDSVAATAVTDIEYTSGLIDEHASIRICAQKIDVLLHLGDLTGECLGGSCKA
ncbi:hypothetical protein [Rhodophyticola porphyridii]|uniref:hypothetical protein n=1 Tax=Rhodophyticola porphyridii TaxID=1852017 RepID=UPI0035CF9869